MRASLHKETVNRAPGNGSKSNGPPSVLGWPPEHIYAEDVRRDRARLPFALSRTWISFINYAFVALGSRDVQ